MYATRSSVEIGVKGRASHKIDSTIEKKKLARRAAFKFRKSVILSMLVMALKTRLLVFRLGCRLARRSASEAGSGAPEYRGRLPATSIPSSYNLSVITRVRLSSERDVHLAESAAAYTLRIAVLNAVQPAFQRLRVSPSSTQVSTTLPSDSKITFQFLTHFK